MVRSLLQQQFPRIVVTGAPDAENTGNFVVTDDSDGEVLSPHSFVSTTERQSLLLNKIYFKYKMEDGGVA